MEDNDLIKLQDLLSRLYALKTLLGEVKANYDSAKSEFDEEVLPVRQAMSIYKDRIDTIESEFSELTEKLADDPELPIKSTNAKKLEIIDADKLKVWVFANCREVLRISDRTPARLRDLVAERMPDMMVVDLDYLEKLMRGGLKVPSELASLTNYKKVNVPRKTLQNFISPELLPALIREEEEDMSEVLKNMVENPEDEREEED